MQSCRGHILFCYFVILLFCFFVRFGGCFGLCIRCLFQGFLLRKMLDNFIFRQLQMALAEILE